METKLKAAVIGGSGFTGFELLKILNNHPFIEVCFTTSKTYDGMDIIEAFPSYSDKSCTKKLKFTVIDKMANEKINPVLEEENIKFNTTVLTEEQPVSEFYIFFF